MSSVDRTPKPNSSAISSGWKASEKVDLTAIPATPAQFLSHNGESLRDGSGVILAWFIPAECHLAKSHFQNVRHLQVKMFAGRVSPEQPGIWFILRIVQSEFSPRGMSSIDEHLEFQDVYPTPSTCPWICVVGSSNLSPAGRGQKCCDVGVLRVQADVTVASSANWVWGSHGQPPSPVSMWPSPQLTIWPTHWLMGYGRVALLGRCWPAQQLWCPIQAASVPEDSQLLGAEDPWALGKRCTSQRMLRKPLRTGIDAWEHP